MKTRILPILLCLVFVNGFAQKKPTGYLLFQYNKTLYDQTRGNNPWGMGIGFQAFLNSRATFTPMIDLTADIYLEDDKVLRLTGDSVGPKSYKTVRSMSNILIGYTFHPARNFCLSFSAGPGFVTGDPFFTIKPSLGFYLLKNKKWTGKFSYINVFNRDKITRKDFGSYSLAIGCKLF